MEIRSAQAADWPDIIAVYKRSQAATGMPDPKQIAPGGLEDYLRERSAIERYVAEDAGQIIGHAMLEEPKESNLSIWHSGLRDDGLFSLVEFGAVFVEPDHMGRGIGSLLLEHCLESAVIMNAAVVCATLENNDAAKRLIVGHGGSLAGSRTRLNGDILNLFVFDR